MIKRWLENIINFIRSWFIKTDSSVKFLLEELENSDLMGIRIKGGNFDGVVFYFRKVGFQEPESKDMPLTLKFEYDIVECVDKSYLEQNLSDFENMIGDYLITVLEEGNNDIESKRTHNPIFSDDERIVFEEDSSVSSE